MKFPRNLGPGLIVTAAFIGPGTITTASRAGAGFAMSLLWAVVFSIVATIILQEMAARLGLVARQGLGEAIRSTNAGRIADLLSAGFVVLAIGFGNAAFQTGNLTGAAEGLKSLTGRPEVPWAVVLGAIAFILLLTGTYRRLELLLIVLVVLMSVVFLLAAVISRPDLKKVVTGLFVPTIPDGSLVTIIALIGTTVVPYNLFLHASSVREKWPAEIPIEQALVESRRDTVLSISVGGLITIAIVITAATALVGQQDFKQLSIIADQLTPILGETAKSAFALGIFAAGLTSSITAPLAGAYAVSGVLGWERDLRSWRFRAVWMIILVAGILCAYRFGNSPVQTIVIAQFANGLLLPVIAIFLLIVVNRSNMMGKYKNGMVSNLLGAAVVLVASALGLWKIWQQVEPYVTGS